MSKKKTIKLIHSRCGETCSIEGEIPKKVLCKTCGHRFRADSFEIIKKKDKVKK